MGRWERRCNKTKKSGAKTKKPRGRNSKWVTVSQDSRKKKKKGSREQPEEEERKEKLRVDVDGGQPALRPTQRFGVTGRKRCDSGGEKNDTSVAACFVLRHTEGPCAGACTAQRPGCTFQYQSLPFHRRHITASPPAPPFPYNAAAPNALNPK